MRNLLLLRLAFASGLVSSIGWASPIWAQDLQIPIVNLTESELSYLYISSVESEDWGDDVLGEEIVVEAGGEYSLSFSSPDGNCFYDILGEFTSSTGEDLEQVFWSIDLCQVAAQGESIAFFEEGFYTSASYEDYASQDYGATIRIINNTDRTLWALTVTDTQQDLLPNTYLEAGQYLDVPLASLNLDPTSDVCNYDLTASFLVEGNPDPDVEDAALPNIDLCSQYVVVGENSSGIGIIGGVLGGFPAGADTLELQELTIQNNTDKPLSELYIVPTGQFEDALNQLSYDLLPSETYPVILPGACGLHDVLGIFYDDSPSGYSVYQGIGIELCNGDTLAIESYESLEGAIDSLEQERGRGGATR